jgi:6-phosphofructokinase 1
MGKKQIKTIGVLTGGGDCPGLNAVIRAVTKSAINDYGMRVIGIHDGFLGLIENRMEELQYDDVSNILTQGGTILGSCNKANPARFPVKIKGKVQMKDVRRRCVEHVRDRGIDAIVCIGGDGTMTGTADLVKKVLHSWGCPRQSTMTFMVRM